MDIMDEMENPVSLPAAEAADGTARADLEAAVAANNLTAAELAQRKEQYYMRELSELRAELDAMKQQQQQQQTTPDGFQSAFLLAFGRLGESPTSWHQATCFALSSDAPEDGWLRGKAGLLLAASALMMFVQSLSACAILVGTTIPSCESNDQCLMPGTFCRVGERNRCDYCGEDNPLELQYHPTLLDPLEAASPGEMDSPRSTWCGPDSVATEREWECGKPHPPGHKMNWAGEWYGYDETLYNTTHVIEVCRSPVNERRGSQDMKFSAVMTIAWCDACMHENTGSVDPLTATRLQQANYRAMSFLDHGTFFFASVIVGLTASGELKDILLCDLAASRAQTMSSGSNRLMSALSGCRRWVVLPAMVSAIPQLVLFRGGDALSIALNTIAVLFLCEIDNLAFMFGFLERLKSRVEAAGRVELTKVDTKALAQTKAVHTFGFVISVMLPVAGGSAAHLWNRKDHFPFSVVMLCMTLAKVAELVGPWRAEEAKVTKLLLQICAALFSAMGGIISVGISIGIAEGGG